MALNMTHFGAEHKQFNGSEFLQTFRRDVSQFRDDLAEFGLKDLAIDMLADNSGQISGNPESIMREFVELIRDLASSIPPERYLNAPPDQLATWMTDEADKVQESANRCISDVKDIRSNAQDRDLMGVMVRTRMAKFSMDYEANDRIEIAQLRAALIYKLRPAATGVGE